MRFFATGEDKVVLEQYKHLRHASRELHQALIARIPKKAFMECAKKLGLVNRNVLVFENENEMAVLFDYCLHAYRPGGKSVMQLHYEKSLPQPASAETALIASMLSSRYSLFSVEKIQRGIGLLLLDILRQEKLFLVDIGLGNSDIEGLVLAGRVMPIGELYMSTGALIPIQGDLWEIVKSMVEKLIETRGRDRELLATPGEETAFSTQVIRAALKSDILDRVRSSTV